MRWKGSAVQGVLQLETKPKRNQLTVAVTGRGGLADYVIILMRRRHAHRATGLPS